VHRSAKRLSQSQNFPQSFSPSAFIHKIISRFYWHVKRFMPYELTLDYHKLDDGDGFNIDMRQQFFEVLQQSSVPYISINNGAFIELMSSPFIDMIDITNETKMRVLHFLTLPAILPCWN
jgi:hypothetical protein